MSRWRAALHRWKAQAAQIRKSPGSHLTSFLILHEMTAVLPIPFIYYTIQVTGYQIPVPQNLVDEGNRRMGKLMRKWFPDEEEKQQVGALPSGLSESDNKGASYVTSDLAPSTLKAGKWDVGRGARVIVDLATSYAIVKLLMPVRLAASLAMTPWFARVAVVPVSNGFKRLFGVFSRSKTSGA
ncbi:hypothetical protein HDV05_005944 [Chytridiales sp. JEL 0842]|nr:hypothetical protein HDV05_005944 [Chytridiales sp. JEL 0842]